MFDYNLYGDPALVREGAVPTFLCGDVNTDEQIDVGDVVYLINYLFIGGSAPKCNPITDCGDVNVDGEVDVGDAIFLSNYLFISGPEPCNP
jgi:oligosaccharide reducing-end xylanase